MYTHAPCLLWFFTGFFLFIILFIIFREPNSPPGRPPPGAACSAAPAEPVRRLAGGHCLEIQLIMIFMSVGYNKDPSYLGGFGFKMTGSEEYGQNRASRTIASPIFPADYTADSENRLNGPPWLTASWLMAQRMYFVVVQERLDVCHQDVVGALQAFQHCRGALAHGILNAEQVAHHLGRSGIQSRSRRI